MTTITPTVRWTRWWSIAALGFGAVLAAINHPPSGWMLGLALTVALAPTLKVTGPSGRVFDMTFTTVAAVPFLTGSLPEALWVIVAGLVAQPLFIRIRSGVVTSPLAAARGLWGGLAYVALVLAGQVPQAATTDTAFALLWMIAALGAWYVVETVLWSAGQAARSRSYVWSIATKDLPLFLAMSSAGAIAGVLLAHIDPIVALVATVVPLALTANTFQRAANTRTTYRRTLRALGRLPEIAGLVPPGHTERTATMGMEVARTMGLTADRVRLVELAGLMANIGRFVADELEPNSYTDSDIDRWSSEIILNDEFLSEASQVVASISRPYRIPGVEVDTSVPVESNILRTCIAYDRAIVAGASPLEAIDGLHHESAYLYNPAVISALRNVVGVNTASI